MPDVTAWLHGNGVIDPEPRAAAAWARIQNKPTQITIKRDGVSGVMTAQTVRIEFDTTRNIEASGAGGKTSVQIARVFGIRDHATLPDTNILRGDRFTTDDIFWYRVIDVILTIGEIQANAVAAS